MTLTTRGSFAWLGMILAGLALGAYVVAAWPDSSPSAAPRPEPVRSTASVSYPESELAGVAGAIYPDDFELGSSPAIDALIGGPPPVAVG